MLDRGRVATGKGVSVSVLVLAQMMDNDHMDDGNGWWWVMVVAMIIIPSHSSS